MELLPCGHISHSPDEERNWASPGFKAESDRQKALCQTLITELKKRGKLVLGTYPPVPHTYETVHIYEAKQHFALLKRRLPRPNYLEQVTIYEQALRDYFGLPPCRRVQTLPLLPAKIPRLLQASDLPTPRTGGRQPSRTIQERNARITELVKAKSTHLVICRTLDRENWPIPPSWRRDGIQTWRQAYNQRPELLHPLISKAYTRKILS